MSPRFAALSLARKNCPSDEAVVPAVSYTHLDVYKRQEHWAVIASLVETAKLNGVEPHAYLADVIARIVNGHPNSRIDELLPWAYPAQAALRDVA